MSKILLTILAVLILTTFVIAEGSFKSFPSVTGTTDTSDAWVEALSVSNLRYELISILIANTDTSSNDITWRVKGFVNPDSDYFYVIADGTDLSDYTTADDVELIERLPSGFLKVTVDVKTTVADSISSYQIDYSVKNSN